MGRKVKGADIVETSAETAEMEEQIWPKVPEQVEEGGERVEVFGVVRLKDGYAVVAGELPVESMRIVHRHLPLANVAGLMGTLSITAARKASDFYSTKVRS